MSQKAVEFVIGRLATDEEARARFRASPLQTVEGMTGPAHPLTGVETDALVSIDPAALDRFADALDPRLQRIAVPRPAEARP